MDYIKAIFLARSLAKSGLIFFIGRNTKYKFLYLWSFLLAPICTLLFFLKIVHRSNLGEIFANLGPIFIKFGQSLSTRGDVIGEEFARSLSLLQDRLAPFSSAEAKKIIRQELQLSTQEIFSAFQDQPNSAASIAQVHKARLKNGEYVAVKILRPNIEKSYNTDIKRLYALVRICNKLFHCAQNLRLLEAVRIFENTMRFELDLKNEAGACAELRSNLGSDEEVIVPKVYWEYTRRKVLVLEWLEGQPLSELIKDSNKSQKDQVIQNLTTTFLNQAFRDGTFHADLHPGNIIITKGNKIGLVDFGIIGRLSDADRFGLAEILHALLSQDYKRVAEIHVEIGYVPENINISDFALACRIAAEPIIGKQISMISIGHLFENLFKITADFGMQTQPQLIFLQKTIIVVEGVAKSLNSEINLWEICRPWINGWASKNLGLDAKIVRLIKALFLSIRI